MAELTHGELHEILRYDPETGHFYWKQRGCGRQIDKPVGVLRRNGYRAINIRYHQYYAHRLAWLAVYGAWPEEEIDHINHDPGDNRIANLRTVSHQENSRNRRTYSTNTTRVPGVDRHGDKWRASITISARRVSLGVYDDLLNACCARKSAERRYEFHANHGREV